MQRYSVWAKNGSLWAPRDKSYQNMRYISTASPYGIKTTVKYRIDRYSRTYCSKHTSARSITMEREKAIEENSDEISVDIKNAATNSDKANKVMACSGNAIGYTKNIETIEEGYSKAHGSRVTWMTDVNLRPPSNTKPVPGEEEQLLDYYNSLQYTLYETDYPETIDRSATPRRGGYDHQVAVAILSAPCECMGILLEGSRQCPDGFHLILSPSWLSRKPSSELPGCQALYIDKAITFQRGGATFIDEFEEPRRVTYLLNYWTDYVTSGYIKDGSGAEVERDLDCPMSSSIPLCELVDNKVWSRGLMADVGVDVPVTLAFTNLTKHLPVSSPNLGICEVSDVRTSELVRMEVEHFLQQPHLTTKKVVVKPSGPGVLGSVGVTYHDVIDVTSVTEAVEALLLDTDKGCSVLVESFVEPIKPKRDKTLLWGVDQSHSFRVRHTVCRDFDGVPVPTLINCGIAPKSSPINGDNTVCQSLDTTLRAFNIDDDRTRQALEVDLREKSRRVMQAVIDYEETLSAEERGELRAQTDVLGIDYIITEEDGKLKPVAIEMNGHDCTINCQIYDFMSSLRRRMIPSCNGDFNQSERFLPAFSKMQNGFQSLSEKEAMTETSLLLKRSFDHELQSSVCRYDHGDVMGESVRPLVRNMIARSQSHVMRDKIVVVIGAGGYSKRNIWRDAARYGIKIILVDSNPYHFARELVYKFITVDCDAHKEDLTHAKDIVNILHKEEIHVDGCVTFWEDCVPLAALVGELLGQKGANYVSSSVAKKKSRTQEVLRMRDADIPHWPRTMLYSSRSEPIKNIDDCKRASERIGFPAILKLEYGSSAVGVSLMNNITELQIKYSLLSGCLRQESDFPGIGLGYDNTMMLTEYLRGSEYDIDVVLFDRKLIGAFISDNGPTNKPSFTETAATMPTNQPTDKQAQLLAAAYQCCTEIGLSDGVFNVEMMMTATGPRLTEINARMGGFYLRDWIKHLYGVDLMLCSFMIACGIRPIITMRAPTEHLMGIMLLPSKHKHILRDDNCRATLEEMHNQGQIIWTKFSDNAESASDIVEEPLGNIAMKGASTVEARQKLLELCRKFDIDGDTYDVSEFVKYF